MIFFFAACITYKARPQLPVENEIGISRGKEDEKREKKHCNTQTIKWN